MAPTPSSRESGFAALALKARRHRGMLVLVSVGTAALVVAAVVAVPALVEGPGRASHAPAIAATVAPVAAATPTAAPRPAPPVVAPAAVAALPEVDYSAVIAGLLPQAAKLPASASTTVYHLNTDAPLFGADPTTPVARFAAKDFLGADSTVVGVEQSGDWALVLTPARSILPSKAPAGVTAPAQTAAWVPTSYLVQVATPAEHVVVSTAAQTVSIVDQAGTVVQSFGAGIGTSTTPTPVGVTGYLEERYVDPSQGTGTHPIQLTSLHSSAADEPYGGSDGGLIGVHYYSAHAGAVSHGCVRLDATALAAIDALPLGTLVTVQ
ncbi:L,D-transpeptidase [Frondihabitans cladoniiphilus]|uniref:L,D-TPase catalytic domain-containing protein n=1 Tax=Frondihabitans cladoniiphilus TaxID=715785 RepID=A0ABP8W693_9MICO